jgi:hypothetical protein
LARPVPEARPDETLHSRAEIVVYDALRTGLPDDWVFLHSLWLKTHPRKLDAEADFVLITPSSVLVLEVKGGIVWRDEKGWHNADLRGKEERPLAEGPFDQARGAMYAMKKHLEELDRRDLWRDFAWGYAVVLPDCRLEVPRTDTQVSAEMLLDVVGFPGNLRGFVDTLSKYWIGRHESRSGAQDIPPGKRRELTLALRPNFARRDGVGVSSLRTRGQIASLTEAQYYALDLREHNDRVMVLGPAGSGKTLVALEAARRAADPGKKVLLTCFNRNLGDHLNETVSGLPQRDRIIAGNFHRVVWELAAEVGRKAPAPDNRREYDSFLEDLAIVLLDAGRAPFDYIVIDEGQDLMSGPVLSFLDAIARDGILRADSKWLLCLDAEQQLYPDNFDALILQRMKEAAAVVPLKRIVRYTRWIDEYTRAVTGINLEFRSAIASEDIPEAIWYERPEELARKLKDRLNRLVLEFRTAGIPLTEIVLLAARREAVPAEILRPGFLAAPVAWVESGVTPTGIRLCTVHGFKGLEAEAVVLVGFDALAAEEEIRLFYVGATRARTHLIAVLPKTLGAFMGAAMARMASSVALTGSGSPGEPPAR